MPETKSLLSDGRQKQIEREQACEPAEVLMSPAEVLMSLAMKTGGKGHLRLRNDRLRNDTDFTARDERFSGRVRVCTGSRLGAEGTFFKRKVRV